MADCKFAAVCLATRHIIFQQRDRLVHRRSAATRVRTFDEKLDKLDSAATTDCCIVIIKPSHTVPPSLAFSPMTILPSSSSSMTLTSFHSSLAHSHCPHPTHFLSLQCANAAFSHTTFSSSTAVMPSMSVTLASSFTPTRAVVVRCLHVYTRPPCTFCCSPRPHPFIFDFNELQCVSMSLCSRIASFTRSLYS